MAQVREEARNVKWDQFGKDAAAINRGEIKRENLSQERRDNYDRGVKVMTELSQNEDRYRTQLVNRIDTQKEVEKVHTDNIALRDTAALQMKIGAVGLGTISAMRAAASAAEASQIPGAAQVGKVFNSAFEAGEKGVELYNKAGELAKSFPGFGSRTATIPEGTGGAGTGAGGGGGGTGSGSEAGARTGGGGGGEGSGKPAGEGKAENPVRSVTEPLATTRELQQSATETINTIREAREAANKPETPAPAQPAPNGQAPAAAPAAPKPFSQVEGAGKIFDSSLKTVNSLSDLQAAHNSGDVNRQFQADTQAVRDTLKMGDTMLTTLGQDRASRGLPNDPNSLGNQIATGFRAGEKIVGVAQTANSATDAAFAFRDGDYKTARTKAEEAFVNGTKTLTTYGTNASEFVKAERSLETAVTSNDTREKTLAYFDYAGHGVGVGSNIVPGAADASKAILRTRDVVEQGFNYRDAVDLSKQDALAPLIKRNQQNINEDIQNLDRLNEYRALLGLPGLPQQIQYRLP